MFLHHNHKKSYGVRHSVRAGSNPRIRPRVLPLPTYAHTMLLREKSSGGNRISLQRRKNFGAAE